MKFSKTGFIHPVSEETYNVLLKLCKGEFFVPVANRTNIEKAAVIKYWRNKGTFSFEGNILLHDGKKVRKDFSLHFQYFL